MRVSRDDAEAAYFTLLRAREEQVALQRYAEYLVAERQRLADFVEQGRLLEAPVPPRVRRPVTHTDQSIGDALKARRSVIDDELTRLEARARAAADFVEECERELERVRAVG